MAGTQLLASLSQEKENSLSISVCRPKALDPVVRLAARGGLKGMQVLDAPVRFLLSISHVEVMWNA